MDGIQYIVSEQGDKTAVLIDLKIYQGLWEDFYDVLLAKSRENEPRENIRSLKKKLLKKGKLNDNL